MKQTIMVIGGYGQVGGYVSKLLSQNGLVPVIAGRKKASFDAFISKESIHAVFRYLDTGSITPDNLSQIDTVIMCLEHNNEQVLQLCINCHINYIDITPSTQYINSLSMYKEQIEQAGISVILGVGIAPGISNLLCKDAAAQFDTITSIDHDLILGVGERHGKNAVKWLVSVLTTPYKSVNHRSDKDCAVYSFTQRNYLFTSSIKRLFTNIDLADTYIIKQHYPNADVHSWFAYDLNWVTKMIVWMQRNHLMSFLRSKKSRTFGEKLFTMELRISALLHIGTNQYMSRIRITGIKNGIKKTIQTSLTGKENSQITASVASYLALHMNQWNRGFNYTEDLTTIHEILTFLHRHKLDNNILFTPNEFTK